METTATKTLWKVDPMHSEVQFKVRHLVISTVTGSFENFEGTIEASEENFESASANFSAEVDSISTGVNDRDNHLKSPDFFDAAAHPQISFNGTFKKVGDAYTLEGPLNIKGNTQEVSFEADFGGTVVDGYGQTKAGFELSSKISRKEFGLSWNQLTETGGVVVGDEVKLIFNVQFTKA